jgi:predicted HTH transcriptional regulator
LQDKGTDKLTQNRQLILAEISKNISITLSKLSVIIGISERKIRENLSELKEKGILERKGAKRNGYRQIIIK